LIDHGYIEEIDVYHLPDNADLVKLVKLTPVGRYYVEQREAIQPTINQDKEHVTSPPSATTP